MAEGGTNIVLVHGFGSSAETWNNLCALLRNDERIAPGFNIHTFAYTTPRIRRFVRRRSPTIGEIAKQLRDELAKPAFDKGDLVLVGHSMGGLVVLSYLAQTLQAGEGAALDRIRQVLLIATPHRGSDYLRLWRKGMSWLVNRQERQLRVLNNEIGDLCKYIQNHVVSAKTRAAQDWPIPTTCFFGSDDRVVVRASARGPFEEVIEIPGDHSGVIEPTGSGDPRYARMADYLILPGGHSNVFEVETYETHLKVEPFVDSDEITVLHGSSTRQLRTDNRAFLNRKVGFSKHNRCRDCFEIRYRSKSTQAFVKPEMIGGENQATSFEKSAYDDLGNQVYFKFAPLPGADFALNLKILNGFDAGNRNVHFHLGTNAYYNCLRYVLDLSAYLDNGYRISEGPRLFLQPTDPGSHDVCEQRGLGDPQQPLGAEARGIWRWEFHGLEEGVVDLVWDVNKTT